MAFTGLMFRGLLIDGNESLEKLEVVKSICNRAPNTEDLMASERKQTTRAIFFFFQQSNNLEGAEPEKQLSSGGSSAKSDLNRAIRSSGSPTGFLSILSTAEGPKALGEEGLTTVTPTWEEVTFPS